MENRDIANDHEKFKQKKQKSIEEDINKIKEIGLDEFLKNCKPFLN